MSQAVMDALADAETLRLYCEGRTDAPSRAVQSAAAYGSFAAGLMESCLPLGADLAYTAAQIAADNAAEAVPALLDREPRFHVEAAPERWLVRDRVSGYCIEAMREPLEAWRLAQELSARREYER